MVMKLVVFFFLVILGLQVQVSGQERDTLTEISVQERNSLLPYRGAVEMPQELSLDFRSGAGFQYPDLTTMNFNSLKGWKIDGLPWNGIGSMGRWPFYSNPMGLYGWSLRDSYQGSYGLRTYQVNNKFYIGTAGFSDKNFDSYLQKSGYLRQSNYGSSLFFGYKFSEKFSISAGFTIQKNGDPWNGSQPMQNGTIFP